MPDTITVKWGGREVALTRDKQWCHCYSSKIGDGYVLGVDVGEHYSSAWLTISNLHNEVPQTTNDVGSVENLGKGESPQAAVDALRAALRSIPDVHEWRSGVPDEPGVYAVRWASTMVATKEWKDGAWHNVDSLDGRLEFPPDEYFTARLV